MPQKILDLNIAPYYDSSQKEIDKGYFKYMAKAGQVLQSRELNVAQGLIYGNLRKVTDLVIEDGTIISGCNYINNEVTKICTLYAGEIYINGVIVKIPEKSWPYKIEDNDDEDTISAENTVIYAEIASYVYDERDDASLYDPAEKMENYGNAGGHRLKYEATVGACKESLYADRSALSGFTRVILYNLKNRHIEQNNVVRQQIDTPIFGKVYKQIAQNTYDASGDFIAEGMQISALENRDNPRALYNISVTSGRAYVRGFMYTFPLTTTITTKAATDTTDNGIIGENKTYHSTSSIYYLNNQNVANVSSVSGTIETEYYPAYCDPNNYTTTIPSNYPVNEILSIWTYKDNSKYTYSPTLYIVQGNIIIWNSTEKPGANDTLHIELTYTGSLTLGRDYVISSNSNGYYIEFVSGGQKPADGKEFNVKYSWYLSRIDLLYIREDGVISVKLGIPGASDEIKEPTVPAGALPLAMINVEPGKLPTEYVVSSYNIYRVPTAQLQNMKQRIEDLEYNVAMTKLESQAQSTFTSEESLTNLKNIYVDPLADYSKADVNNARYAATLDFFALEARLPQTIKQLNKNNISYVVQSSAETNGSAFGNGVLYLDIVNKPMIASQILATNDIDIVPYAFKGLRPQIDCTPEKIVTVDDVGETAVIWLPTRVIYSTITVSNWIRNQTTTNGIWNGRAYGWGSVRLGVGATNLGTSKTMSATSTTTSYEETVLQTDTTELIPQPNIKAGELLTITGKDWPANTEIRIYLDDSVIVPEFNNIIYTESAPFYMPNDTSVDPNNSAIANNIVNFDNIGPIRRSNVWQWQKVPMTDAENVWKISHPLYVAENDSTDGISYYYNLDADRWYYKRENTKNTVESLSSLSAITVDTSDMKWCKFLTRAPWVNHYILTDITLQSTRSLLQTANMTEPLTGETYSSTYSSTKTTIITDSTGSFTAAIAIPEGTVTGTHTITAETILPKDFDPDYYFAADDEFSGEAYIRKTTTYIYKQKTEIINKVVYNDIVQVTHNYSSDPIAQSFVFEEEQYLSGIDLYFNVVPWTVTDGDDSEVRKNSSVIFTIRKMENGYPTRTLLYQKEITGVDKDSNGNYIIQLAGNKTAEGDLTPTHIEFDYPVYIEANTQYAFSIGSNKDGFHILYAQMGERDLVTNEPVTLQPVTTGVMFSSSDNSTWTPHQEADVTYKLYGVEFSTASKNYYLTNIMYNNDGNATAENYFSTMNVSIDTAVFEDTDVETSYAINVEGNVQDYVSWKPLTLEEKYEFSADNSYISNGMNLAIKITLSSDNNKLTPIVNLNTLEIYLAKYKSSGSYILNSINIE